MTKRNRFCNRSALRSIGSTAQQEFHVLEIAVHRSEDQRAASDVDVVRWGQLRVRIEESSQQRRGASVCCSDDQRIIAAGSTRLHIGSARQQLFYFLRVGSG